jgi:DNA-binding NtrC family response regulator
MRGRIVVVHDEIDFLVQAVLALRRAGCDVVHFTDPSTALLAFGGSQSVELLITPVFFRPGTLNGASLAFMVKMKQPELKVIFIAAPEYSKDYLRFGEFLPSPISIPNLMAIVERLLPSLHPQ